MTDTMFSNFPGIIYSSTWRIPLLSSSRNQCELMTFDTHYIDAHQSIKLVALY